MVTAPILPFLHSEWPALFDQHSFVGWGAGEGCRESAVVGLLAADGLACRCAESGREEQTDSATTFDRHDYKNKSGQFWPLLAPRLISSGCEVVYLAPRRDKPENEVNAHVHNNRRPSEYKDPRSQAIG